MRRKTLRAILIFLSLAVFAVPLAAWFFFKPIRALLPEFAGLQCYSSGVCVEDPTQLPKALSLKLEAVHFVENVAGRFEHVPRVLFCTTAACERWFGFKGNAAFNVGTAGLVIAKRGWEAHYIRHELIHHVQVERIGGTRMWLRTPTWFIEGMAYSLSADPRRPLEEPWEGYRTRYESWATQHRSEELWSLAREL